MMKSIIMYSFDKLYKQMFKVISIYQHFFIESNIFNKYSDKIISFSLQNMYFDMDYAMQKIMGIFYTGLTLKYKMDIMEDIA